MESPESLEGATPSARTSAADVYAWASGRVLKLFHEHTPLARGSSSPRRGPRMTRVSRFLQLSTVP